MRVGVVDIGSGSVRLCIILVDLSYSYTFPFSFNGLGLNKKLDMLALFAQATIKSDAIPVYFSSLYLSR